MAPRGYNRYMLVVGAGNNRKFARLNDSERCAHFLGVLSVAAQSPIRGYLLLSVSEPAGAEEIAAEARVPVKVAQSTLEKLKRVGVLERDDTLGAWFVHDWEHVNPPPKKDPNNAKRQRDFRERNADSNGGSNAPRNATVTPDITPPEVEVEVEEQKTNVNTTVSLRSTDRAFCLRVFEYWQETCGHPNAKPTRDRLSKIDARRREGYSEENMRQAIDGAARAPFVNEAGKRFDDIELICRNGAKLESFMARAGAGNVVRMARSPALERMDEWQDAPEYRGNAS